jgi:curved DNA-binding protein CbpA
MERDYYQILGVTRNAPEKEIKRAYHKLARQLHPDKASSPEDLKRFEEEFALVSKAYNTLKDPEKRAPYDKTLHAEKEAVIAEPPPPAVERKPVEPFADPTQRLQIAQKAYNRGVQFFKLAEYPRAIEFFEAAIRTYDKEPSFYSKLAQSLLCSHRGFTKAVEACTKAIELDPYNVEYKLILAEVFEAAGSYSLARKSYLDVLKWDTTNEKAKEKLSRIERLKIGGSLLGKLRAIFRK